jgi:hypothetical protein
MKKKRIKEKENDQERNQQQQDTNKVGMRVLLQDGGCIS